MIHSLSTPTVEQPPPPPARLDVADLKRGVGYIRASFRIHSHQILIATSLATLLVVPEEYIYIIDT